MIHGAYNYTAGRRALCASSSDVSIIIIPYNQRHITNNQHQFMQAQIRIGCRLPALLRLPDDGFWVLLTAVTTNSLPPYIGAPSDDALPLPGRLDA